MLIPFFFFLDLYHNRVESALEEHKSKLDVQHL